MYADGTGITLLPPELILHVSGFIKSIGRFACIPDLISCALVCKHWLSIFRPMIHPVHILNSAEELRELAKAAGTVPRFLFRVRDVEFHQNVDGTQWIDIVPSIFPRNLANLRSIRLVGFSTHFQTPVHAQRLHIAYPSSRHFARLRSSFGAITTLILQDCVFEGFTHLVRIVCGCIKLERVDLIGCRWGDNDATPSNAIRMANNTMRLITVSRCEAPLSLLWLLTRPDDRSGTETLRAAAFIRPCESPALIEIIEHVFNERTKSDHTTYLQREPGNSQ